MSMGEIEEFQDKHKVDLDSCNEDSFVVESGFGNVIVVDNLPVVAANKYDKLVRANKKIFGITEENCLWMPAIQRNNKKRLDSSHILAVNSFEDFVRFMKLAAADECAAPEIKPYTPWENLQQWLNDVKARDQFVIRAGNDTEIFWNDPRQSGPDLVYRRTSWSDSFVQWSSYGTYLSTLNAQGVDVWGGAATFGYLSRCAHEEVELIDFSPGEKYLVTYSSQGRTQDFPLGRVGFSPSETHSVVLNIFDEKTGKVMRGFEGSADEFAVGGVSRSSWSLFGWGGGKDDKYFARIGKNVVSIYETQNFTLIDKKSLRVENMLDFSWSPADPIIALLVPELDGGNQPAKVSLVQIPGKEELMKKNLFGVIDCKMYWQGNREYLAVNYTKTRKSTCASFELFRIKEKDIPIEVMDPENKNDKIIAFALEPKGHRFAIIHGDSLRVDVSFYSMRTATNSGRVTKFTALHGKNAASALHWSPFGRFIVVAGLNGQLEFYDVDELETMAIAEHFMATNIEWDPTGGYFHEMENGFNIWSFTGKLLCKISNDQFSWRPRPPSFLPARKEKEISKNLGKFSKKYESEDQDAAAQLHEKGRKNREMLQQEWDFWIKEWKQLHEEEKFERQQLLINGEASDDEPAAYEAELVEVEEFLDVREETVE
ncbi:hypothetical protein MKX03_031172 [Papaver bracteatum]|nr:hypothetical protein MKX03_031172 [Papaver bracteatum]